MKKYIQIIGMILLFSSNMVFGQDKATDIVNKMVKSIRDRKNVEMTFSYQYESDNGSLSEKQQGHAYLQGEAYKIIMNDQQTISDGTTIWSYLVDDEEVMVSNASEGTDNTPIKLITTFDKDYTTTLKGTDAKGIAEIELNNPKGQYKKVVLKIDSKKNELKQAEIFADDGSKLIMNIVEMKYDLDLTVEFFRFDEKDYPNVDIIDMR